MSCPSSPRPGRTSDRHGPGRPRLCHRQPVGPDLTVEVVGATKEGKVERQLYRRTLVDATHLKLAYTREVAGRPASTIEAEFIRKPA